MLNDKAPTNGQSDGEAAEENAEGEDRFGKHFVHGGDVAAPEDRRISDGSCSLQPGLGHALELE